MARIPKTAARDLKPGDTFALFTSPESPTAVVVGVEVASEQFVNLTYTREFDGRSITQTDRMKGHRPYRVIAKAGV